MTVATAKLPATFETLTVTGDGGVLFVDIAAPPMNLLGPELVRDLVTLIQAVEDDDSVQVPPQRGGPGEPETEGPAFESRRAR